MRTIVVFGDTLLRIDGTNVTIILLGITRKNFMIRKEYMRNHLRLFSELFFRKKIKESLSIIYHNDGS